MKKTIKDLTIKDLKNIEIILRDFKYLLEKHRDVGVNDPYVQGTLDRNYNYTNIMKYLEYAIPNIEDYLDEPNDETTIKITYL